MGKKTDMSDILRKKSTSAPPAQGRLSRCLFTGLALLSLGVGLVGIFLPGLPSTEFFLLAAWAAARGSPRLRAWLYRHPTIGPLLQRWDQGRRVSRRAKWAASLTMGLSAALIGWMVRPPLLALGLVACMAGVLLWLWRRPE